MGESPFTLLPSATYDGGPLALCSWLNETNRRSRAFYSVDSRKRVCARGSHERSIRFFSGERTKHDEKFIAGGAGAMDRGVVDHFTRLCASAVYHCAAESAANTTAGPAANSAEFAGSGANAGCASASLRCSARSHSPNLREEAGTRPRLFNGKALVPQHLRPVLAYSGARARSYKYAEDRSIDSGRKVEPESR